MTSGSISFRMETRSCAGWLMEDEHLKIGVGADSHEQTLLGFYSTSLGE